MKHILLIAALAAVLISCKKETTPTYNSNVKADLSVEFDNIAGSADLALITGIYTNASGENFTVTKLKYFVSNFVLTNTDGSVYTVPQDSCYFLVDESDEDTHEPVIHIPEGEYKSVNFTLGLDSLRNTRVATNTGMLDTAGAAAGMYWDYNSGYIFFDMEGTSPASATGFKYQVGGYGGATTPVLNNIKNITLDLTARGTPKVKSGKETNIHLMIDVTKFFAGAATFSIAAHPVVMFDAFSSVIANNFAGMIRHDHTEN